MPAIPFSPTSKTPSKLEQLRREALLSAAVVCSMPIVILGVLAAANPTYVSRLLYGPGLVMFIAAGALIATGGTTMWLMGRAGNARDAERLIASLGPRMSVPMILTILPALFMVLIGPAVLEVMERDTVSAGPEAQAAFHRCTDRVLVDLGEAAGQTPTDRLRKVAAELCAQAVIGQRG